MELILTIVIVILLIFLLKDFFKEGYANKDDKANSIFEWFNNNPNPKYAKYQKEVADSDIVEYSDVKQKMNLQKKITKRDVLNVL